MSTLTGQMGNNTGSKITDLDVWSIQQAPEMKQFEIINPRPEWKTSSFSFFSKIKLWMGKCLKKSCSY
jgi:hypothetical protein